jgi:hypothetical protein
MCYKSKTYLYNHNYARIRHFPIRIIALIIFVCFNILIKAQQTDKVLLSGQVVEKGSDQAIPYASVRLFSLPDSTMIVGGRTDDQGKFKFTITLNPKNNYQLNITYLGYDSYDTIIKPSSHKVNLDFGQISLTRGSISLNEATITAKAPEAVTVGDTTIYNSSAYRTPEGSMLEELVKQLPGSEISDDGKLLIHGKEVKKILVDGKEFFSDDPKVALKNLPVEMVEKLKAYERKSDLARLTGIDDGDDEMILDLSVKKDMKKGWKENFFSGIGSKGRWESGNTFNRFRENSQFSIIGNLNNTNNQGFSELQQQSSSSTGNTRSRDGLTTSRSSGINFSRDWTNFKLRTNIQYSKTNRSNITHTFVDNFLRTDKSNSKSENNTNSKNSNFVGNLFMEWKIDSLSTLIFRPQFHYNLNKNENHNTQQSWANDSLINDKIASSKNDDSRKDFSMSMQLNRKLSSKGRNIAISLDYGTNNTTSNRLNLSTINYYRKDTTRIINQKIERPTDGNNYRLQLVYVEPLLWAHFLQIRYSYQHRTSHSDRNVYNWNYDLNDFSEDTDTLTSNYFENQYSNHLFNLAIRTSRLKYNYNFGIDLEPQRTSSHSITGNESHNEITRNVWNYSPTANFTYKFDKNTRLRITYRGRSKQPDIYDLQPVIDISNPLYIRVGNPDLKPSYTNTFMIDYNSFNSKYQRNIVLSVLAENTINNVTSQVTYDNETGVRTTKPVNMNGNWHAQGSFSLNTPIINRHIMFRTNSYVQYSNQNGYTTINRESPLRTSVTHLTAQERIQLAYRIPALEIALRGDIRYNNSYNNVRDKRTETYDYHVGGNFQLYLPWNFELYSDINYNLRLGYGYSKDLRKNIMWNCQLSKSFFKRKQLLLRFKIYDILKQETSLVRNITSTYIRDTDYNVLGSYFMFHAIVRINTLGGRHKKSPRK